MNRRTLLGGALATAAGLLLPATLDENVETVRRYWSLDRTMVTPASYEHVTPKYEHTWKWEPSQTFTLTFDGVTSQPIPYESLDGPITVDFGRAGMVIEGMIDYNALAPAFAALFGAPITVRKA
jgi:hypothetical protein